MYPYYTENAEKIRKKLIANDSLMFIYNGTIFSAVYNEITKEYTLTPANDGSNH